MLIFNLLLGDFDWLIVGCFCFSRNDTFNGKNQHDIQRFFIDASPSSIFWHFNCSSRFACLQQQQLFLLYKIVHHGHSPGVVELNSMQLAHRHEVAPCGRS